VSDEPPTFEQLTDELEIACRRGYQLNDARITAARSALRSHVAELEKEIKARGEIYGAMCDRLHACCQKYKLGLGGEHVDRLVVEEVDRLRALETRVFQFVAMGEPITVEAFSDLAPHD